MSTSVDQRITRRSAKREAAPLQPRAVALRAIAFTAVLAAAVAGLDRWVAQSIATPDEFRFAEAKHATRPWPVVAVGASRIAHGLDPRGLEARGALCYDFAFDGATPSYLLAWIERFLVPNRHAPRLVILGIAPPLLEKGRATRTLAHDSEFSEWGQFVADLWQGNGERGTLLRARFPVLKYRRRIPALLWGGGSLPARATPFRGFLADARQLPADLPPNEYHFAPNEREMAALREMTRLLRQRGSRVVWVQAPCFAPGYRVPAAVGDAITALARELRVPYLDYNGPLRSHFNEERGMFADNEHLSRGGARIWSSRLARMLDRAGLLPPLGARELSGVSPATESTSPAAAVAPASASEAEVDELAPTPPESEHAEHEGRVEGPAHDQRPR